MVTVVASSFDFGILCISAKHTVLRSKSKTGWLEVRRDTHFYGLLFQWGSALIIQLNVLV